MTGRLAATDTGGYGSGKLCSERAAGHNGRTGIMVMADRDDGTGCVTGELHPAPRPIYDVPLKRPVRQGLTELVNMM